MHCITHLMEDGSHIALVEQIFLYLPLVDLLECKYVSRLWYSYLERLLRHGGDHWAHWSHPQLARKMAAAITSVVDGTVIEKLHLNMLYKDLSDQGYDLVRCVPYKGVIILMFQKTEQASTNTLYCFYIVPWKDVNEILYVAKFSSAYASFYFGSRYLLVIWYFNHTSGDYIQLHFLVINDFTNFREQHYTTSIRSCDFVSPVVSLHTLLLGDTSLPSAIQMQFLGLNYPILVSHPDSSDFGLAHCGAHEIFYPTRLCKDASDIWVLDIVTLDVIIKRSTSKLDWICYTKDSSEIKLLGYKHPFATFRIKTSNALAVWNLSQHGRPRHISFDTEIPREPLFVHKSWSRSKWIICVYEVSETSVFYVNLPTANILKNSLASCQCMSSSTQACSLNQQKLALKTSRSTQHPRMWVYFAGDRFTIQGNLDSPEALISDCWKSKEGAEQLNNLGRFVKFVISTLKMIFFRD